LVSYSIQRHEVFQTGPSKFKSRTPDVYIAWMSIKESTKKWAVGKRGKKEYSIMCLMRTEKKTRRNRFWNGSVVIISILKWSGGVTVTQ